MFFFGFVFSFLFFLYLFIWFDLIWFFFFVSYVWSGFSFSVNRLIGSGCRCNRSLLWIEYRGKKKRQVVYSSFSSLETRFACMQMSQTSANHSPNPIEKRGKKTTATTFWSKFTISVRQGRFVRLKKEIKSKNLKKKN